MSAYSQNLFVEIQETDGSDPPCIVDGNEYRISVVSRTKACACIVSISGATSLSGNCIDLISVGIIRGGTFRIRSTGGPISVTVREGCGGSGSQTSNGESTQDVVNSCN